MIMTTPYLRTRTNNEPDQMGEVEREGYSPTVLGNYVVSRVAEQMYDTVTPGYRRKIAAGKVINNECEYIRNEIITEGSGIKVSGLTSGSSKDATTKGPITRHYCGDRVNVDDLTTDQPDRMASAKFQALSRVDDTPYAFGEDVGELRETMRFLKNPLTSIFGLGKRFQKELRTRHHGKTRGDARTTKQKLTAAKHNADAAADLWLSYRFALRPLVRSAHDAIEAALYRIEASPERRTARGYSNWEHSAHGAGTSGTSTNQYTYSKGYQIEKKWKAVIMYEVSNPCAAWQRDLGLRGKDFPHTMWQLMPYSFMVDRMVDIGGAIRGLTNLADPNVKILAGSVTIKKDEQQWHRFESQYTPGWHHSITGEKRIHKEFVYKRVTWRPGYRDAMPPINIGGLVDSATKNADLVALALKAFRI